MTAETVFKQLIPRNPNDFEFSEITINQMAKIIHKSKPTKSRGNDEVNMFTIKEIPQLVSIALTHLCNTMVRKGVFPSALKTSRVIPILKPGKCSKDLKSFRPINNMNAIDKLIEEIMKTQLTDFVETNKIVNINMHGSRKNYSIVTAKMCMDESINKASISFLPVFN